MLRLRRFYPRLLTLAVAHIVFLVGPPVPEGASETPRRIAEKARLSVVVLSTYDASGRLQATATGFFVRADVVVTNFHVVAGASAVTAKPIGRAVSYRIRGVVATDEDGDLVLLKAVNANAPALTLGDESRLAVGDKIYAIGNPRGLEGTFSEGIVSAFRDDGDRSLIQITAPVSPGSSGGPVLDSDGRAIGVAVSSIREGQNLNFAIPTSRLRKLLAAAGAETGFPRASRSTSPSGDRADDVPGWQATRWGMSQAEVRRALGTEYEIDAIASDREYTKLRTRLRIAGADCVVELWFRLETQGLERVLIRPDAESDDGAKTLAAAVFLRQLLVDKYGAPHGVEPFPSVAERWRFPTTIIRFYKSFIGQVGNKVYAIAGITYEPTEVAESQRRRESDKL